jgi:ribonuclease HI
MLLTTNNKMDTGDIKIFCDGGARGNPGPSACAFVVKKNGKTISSNSSYLGVATNNIAEYSAVDLAYSWILGNGDVIDGKIFFYLDSELVTRQLIGIYKIKNQNLKIMYERIKEKESKINNKIIFISIPRDQNIESDLLVNKCLDENSLNFTSTKT